MKKVSIIIPMYNCEKTITKCIDSIINQSYKELEIIAINDGSKDNTLEIVKNIKDERIKIINKKNEGVSATRNLGIKLSTGDYIMFVDADDYIDNNYIEEMIENSEDYNIIISGAKLLNEKYELINKDLYINKTTCLKYSDIKEDIVNTIYFSASWKMLIKQDFIKSNKFFFNEDIKYGEDFLFNYQLMKNQNILYVASCGYNYIQNQNSYTHSIKLKDLSKQIDDSIFIYDRIKEDFSEESIIYNRILSKINIHLKKLFQQNYKPQKEIKPFIIDQLKKVKLNKIDLQKINYLSILDMARLKLLKKERVNSYIIFNMIVFKAKRIIKK